MFHRRRSQSGRHPDLTGALKVDARVEVSRVMYSSRVSSSIYMTSCHHHLKYWSSSCRRVYLFAPREVLSLSLRIGKIDSRAIASSDLQPPESSLSILPPTACYHELRYYPSEHSSNRLPVAPTHTSAPLIVPVARHSQNRQPLHCTPP